MMSQQSVGVIATRSKTPMRPLVRRPSHGSEPAALVRSLGKTSLVITHCLEELIELANRVLAVGSAGRHILTEMQTTPSERRDPGRCAGLRRAPAAVEAGERRTT